MLSSGSLVHKSKVDDHISKQSSQALKNVQDTPLRTTIRFSVVRNTKVLLLQPRNFRENLKNCSDKPHRLDRNKIQGRQNLCQETMKTGNIRKTLTTSVASVEQPIQSHPVSYAKTQIEMKHFCVICEKGYKKWDNLFVHLRAHTREKPFKCGRCEEPYGYMSNRRRHELHCLKLSTSITLEFAGTSKAHKYETKTQKIAKKKRKKTQTNPSVVQKTQLALPQPSSCKADLKSGSVKLHRLGISKMPRMQNLCQKTMKTNIILKTQCATPVKHRIQDNSGHSVKLSAARKHVCIFCGKADLQRKDLFIHLRAHTREKPFTCGRCEEMFGYMSNRRRHEILCLKSCTSITTEFGGSRASKDENKTQKVTKNSGKKIKLKFKFKCVFCRKIFSKVKKLELHSQSKHNVNFWL